MRRADGRQRIGDIEFADQLHFDWLAPGQRTMSNPGWQQISVA